MSYFNLRVVAVATLSATLITPVCAQTLARRIESASGSAVEFHFAARSGVCGDGRTYMRTDADTWNGSFVGDARMLPCEAGPVRVVVVRNEREAIRLETYAGPLARDSSSTNLGSVSASAAAAYLLELARTSEGRVARDALLPATLADSASVVAPLLTLARDQTKSRDLRRSAMNYASRRRNSADAMSAEEVIRVALAMAQDETEHMTMRQNAVAIMGRTDRGEGVNALIQLSRSTNDMWLAKSATEVLARSGDPRARRALRDLVESNASSGDIRAQAIRGLANEYANAQDAELLQRVYDRLDTDKAKDAALEAIGAVGSSRSREWLIALTKNTNELSRQRRKAASLLDKAGTTVREMVRLYDELTDDDVRGVLIDELASAGTKEAVAKLVAIAKDPGYNTSRRRAIAALGRFDDPEIRTALRGVVER